MLLVNLIVFSNVVEQQYNHTFHNLELQVSIFR